MARPDIFTVHGHLLPEVVSALQKSIRRCDIEGSVYWAAEMARSGYSKYLWKRLMVIMSEDIGLAEPNLPAQVMALRQSWLELEKVKGPAYLPLIHAVLLMAHAKKSHAVVHAEMFLQSFSDTIERPEIPDYAFDMHTRKGRRMGRGGEHFVEVAGKLENEDTSHDSEELRAIWEEFVRRDYNVEGAVRNPVKFGKLGKPLENDAQQGSFLEPDTEFGN